MKLHFILFNIIFHYMKYYIYVCNRKQQLNKDKQ